MGSLVARLRTDVTRIVRAELALAQARVSAVLDAVRAAGALLAIGIVLALAGIGALVASLVLVVAQWLLPWAAALVVGGALLMTALVLLAVQARIVTRGVRDALADVQLEISGEEGDRGGY